MMRYMKKEKCKMCESCFMPFDKDPGTRESDQYCSYCFKNGGFVYDGGSLKEFQRLSYEGMRSGGMSPMKAKVFAWMIRFAPRWKK